MLIEFMSSPVEVIKVEDQCFYKMYKNGSNSIVTYVQQNKLKYLTHDEIKKQKNINVFLREPKDRLIAGLSSYCIIHKISDYENLVKRTQDGEIWDIHFGSQYHWLLKLARTYRNTVTFHPIQKLSKFIGLHIEPHKKTHIKDKIKKIIDIDKFEKTICLDRVLIDKFQGKTAPILHVLQQVKK